MTATKPRSPFSYNAIGLLNWARHVRNVIDGEDLRGLVQQLERGAERYLLYYDRGTFERIASDQNPAWWFTNNTKADCNYIWQLCIKRLAELVEARK